MMHSRQIRVLVSGSPLLNLEELLELIQTTMSEVA